MSRLDLLLRQFIGQARRVRPTGILLGLAVAVGISIAVLAGGLSRAQSEVYRRYNDSLVRHDLGTAYLLICQVDRQSLTLAAFEDRFDRAVQPLGGLSAWNPLRGGAEWLGRNGASVRRRPRITDSESPCVQATTNPLGEPF